MYKRILSLSFLLPMLWSCDADSENKRSGSTVSNIESAVGQSAVKDDISQKNVVQVAVGSVDHTTLVKAVQAATLSDALSNTGPFTVFAPTNAAFDKLPKGTVENLLKPESKDALTDILQYHVSLGVYKANALQDGQVLGQVNGGNVTVSVKDGKIMIGGATIIASIPASNGIVHVIDGVLLPPKQ